jgi:glycosyltransferase involved in cell wall biosynthesis
MQNHLPAAPLVSVIIPSWNHGPELMRCLASLESQTYGSFEVIVVDDGSTDGTADMVKNFKHSFPLDYVRLERNAGASAARNAGERRSRGELLMFADADAELRPHAIERMAAELEKHPECDFAYSSFRFGWKKFGSRPFDAKALRRIPYIHTTSMLRRRAFPGFDESLKKFQDWDLWLTMSERGSTGSWIPEVLFSIKARRLGMSRWLPSFFHKLPWECIGWAPRELRNYRKWEKVVKEKHGIRP